MSKHQHTAYKFEDGDLKCVGCGEPSKSDKWRKNMGLKAQDPKDNKAAKGQTENKSKG